MHRVVMENFLGRVLEDNEVVHHKDNNKKNNSIDNLELLTNTAHKELHGKEKGRKILKLKCPWRGKEFTKYRNLTHLQKPSNYNCTCCCSSCRGKLYRSIQLNGVTPRIQEAIANNVIAEEKRYLS